MRTKPDERGAAAVEFALILIPFLTLILALVDLGWVFNQQLAVTSAARQAVRDYAVLQQENPSSAVSTAEANAQDLVTGTLSFSWTYCSATPGAQASVTVSTPLTDLTGWLGAIAPSATQQATGTMRCGG